MFKGNPYYDEIVVGSSLRALLFAAERDIPVFFTEPEKPFEFDFLDYLFPSHDHKEQVLPKSDLLLTCGYFAVGCSPELRFVVKTPTRQVNR